MGDNGSKINAMIMLVGKVNIIQEMSLCVIIIIRIRNTQSIVYDKYEGENGMS